VIPQRIALVGLPRSGKSTLGPLLAEHLGYAWLDSDQGITESTGRSPADWIAEDGMPAFREAESKWLRETPFPAELILSTGGGLPCSGENMDWLLAHFCNVHLELDLQTWLQRMQAPPRHTLCTHYSQSQLEALYQERLAIYAKAQFKLPTFASPLQNISTLTALFS